MLSRSSLTCNTSRLSRFRMLQYKGCLVCLQGTKPEVRTYNTIISACNRSGQPENALRVYERMLADGAQPTATTYTALISAYGKTGKVCWHLDVGASRELFWLAAVAVAPRASLFHMAG